MKHAALRTCAGPLASYREPRGATREHRQQLICRVIWPIAKLASAVCAPI